MPARPSLLRLLASVTLSLALVSPAVAREPAARPNPAFEPVMPVEPAATFVPGELVIGFEPGVSAGARARSVQAAGARLKRELDAHGTVVIELPAGADPNAASAAWRNRAGVRFAEPNYVYHTTTTPNDPRFGDLWGLHNANDHDIDAPEAWDITTGSSKVVVAVVDSGVDYTHPDLAPNMWANSDESVDGKDNDGNGLVDDIRGWDFVNDDNDPMDQNGHGTHVAGTIGARGNNGAGITGVNWNVRIMPLRAGNANGSLTNADIIDAFDYACDQGADIVNGSFGGPQFAAGVSNAISACPQALFVFAAGNDGGNNDVNPSYPCNDPAPNVVCVAATNANDALAGFSNHGATSVDLAAPGQSILSASYLHDYFTDGFEAGFAKWTVGKESGTSWSRTNETAAKGSYSATDSAGANYKNNSNTWMDMANPISLSGGTRCRADFAVKLDTELSFDGLAIEGSRDGGSTWQLIDGLTGSTSGVFIPYASDLKAAGFDGAGSFLLSFRLVSDAVVTRDGAHIDDVAVRCHPATHGSNDYVSFSGTSMATPHVAGVAALVLAAHPNLNTDTLRQSVLDGVDPLPALSGLVASSGRLNARGALDAVETVRPAAKPPSQRLISNSTATTSELVPIRVSWAAATDAEPSSGIFRYTLQHRQKSGSTWGAWQTVANVGGRSRTVKLAPGQHQFRVRAEDRAGNRSRWKAGSQFALADPQGSPEVTFGGTWAMQTSANFFDGSTRYAGARGRTALLAFEGREVAWVASLGPNRGRAKVYVDGVLVKTVDLYNGTVKNRRVVFRKRWSTSGSHTIMIKVTSKNASSAGKRVDLDAYLTLN